MKKSKIIEFQLPSSKSLSNRALILNYLLPSFQLSNLSEANDTIFLQAAIKSLESNKSRINCGEGGTTYRFLTALAVALQKEVQLEAEGKMRERPISDLVSALRQIGAQIDYLGKEGCPPIKISPAKLKAQVIKIDPSVSSQFITALMLIAPKLEHDLEIAFTKEPVSFSYLEMTKGIMERAGLKVNLSQSKVKVQVNNVSENSYLIENDWSSASYAYLARMLTDEDILIPNLSLNSLQGDVGIVQIFDQLGILTEQKGEDLYLTKVKHKIDFLEVDCEQMPDMAMSFMMGAVLCGIGGKFTGLETLPKKESQRIAVMHTIIEQLGGKCESNLEELSFDAFDWNKRDKIIIDTHDDHRIMMIGGVLQLENKMLQLSENKSHKKSFPNFWQELDKLRE
jgi:3-phosphoshikimate 1-carboxyvinyltransferase